MNSQDIWTSNARILRRADTLLVVVDMQQSILQAIHDREKLQAQVRLLAQTARVLQIPVLATTQYAERLGPIIPELHSLFSAAPVFDKLSFSAVGELPFLESVERSSRRQVLLCGVETHICVSQTALDLTALGYQVHVAADGVSARSLEKHKLGMERIRDNGIFPCAAEAAVYELLRAAGSPKFKEILPFVKALP